MSEFFAKLTIHSWAAFVSIPIIAVLGAFVNMWAKSGGKFGTIWMFLASVIVTIPWVVLVKYSTLSLSVTAAIFDALYSIAYFIAFVYMGESASMLQWAGAGVTVFGIILMTL